MQRERSKNCAFINQLALISKARAQSKASKFLCPII